MLAACGFRGTATPRCLRLCAICAVSDIIQVLCIAIAFGFVFAVFAILFAIYFAFAKKKGLARF